MSEGLRNTIVGVVMAALLAGIGAMLAQTKTHGEHLAKIDQVLEGTQDISKANNQMLWEMRGSVPKIVEDKLVELRERLNQHELRLNKVEAKP